MLVETTDGEAFVRAEEAPVEPVFDFEDVVQVGEAEVTQVNVALLARSLLLL